MVDERTITQVSLHPHTGQFRIAGPVRHRIRARHIVFVHGFATTPRAAAENYTRMARRLAGRFDLSAYDLHFITWPGHFSRWQLGPLRYPTALRRCPGAGRALARYLQYFFPKDGAEIVLIGHSLGCRVILEALNALQAAPPRARPASSRLTMLLMGGAVPRDTVSQPTNGHPGDLRDGLESVRKRIVYYSVGDLVLTLAFPPGQRAAGESASNAIGVFGEPFVKAWSARRHMYGYDHNDYWRRGGMVGEIQPHVATSGPRRLPDRRLRRRDFMANQLAAIHSGNPERLFRNRTDGR